MKKELLKKSEDDDYVYGINNKGAFNTGTYALKIYKAFVYLHADHCFYLISFDGEDVIEAGRKI